MTVDATFDTTVDALLDVSPFVVVAGALVAAALALFTSPTVPALPCR
jgi:hypothetical protein